MKESCLLSSATTEAELKTGAALLLQLKGATEQDLKTLEENVYAAAETMTSYDSLEERVGGNR